MTSHPISRSSTQRFLLTNTHSISVFLISILLSLTALTHTALAQNTAVYPDTLYVKKFSSPISGIAFSNNGQLLAVSSDSTFILRPLTADTLAVLPRLRHFQFTDNDNSIIGFSLDDSALVKYSIQEQRLLKHFRFPFVSEYSRARFSKDGSLCISTLSPHIDGTPPPKFDFGWMIIDVESGTVLLKKEYIGKNGIVDVDIRDVHLDCLNQPIVGLYKIYRVDNKPRGFYDIERYSPTTGDSLEHIYSSFQAVLSSDCSLIACREYDSSFTGVTLFNRSNPNAKFSLPVNGVTLSGMQFSNDNKFLFVTSNGLKVFDVNTGSTIYENTWATHSGLAVAPAGDLVATRVYDYLILLKMPFITSVSDKDPQNNNDVLYPNPSNGILSVSADIPHDGMLSLTIVSANGSQIQTLPAQPVVKGRNLLSLPTTGLASGAYSLRLSMLGYQKMFSFILSH